MTSKHRHTTTGTYKVAGTIDEDLAALTGKVDELADWSLDADARYDALERRVAALEGAEPGPTPTPIPPPAGRPFPPPVTTSTRKYTTGDPQAFIDAAPNGTILEFPAGLDVTLSKGLLLERRDNLVIKATGATFRFTGPDSERLSPFLLRGSNHIAIEGGTVIGTNTDIVVAHGELSHALSLSGWYAVGPSTYVEMSGVTASKMYGDGVYAEGRNGGSFEPSHHVWVHHNKFDTLGRNGVSPINVTDLLIEDNTWDKVSYHQYDIEPNFTTEQVRRFTVRRDKVGSYGHRANLLGFFLRNWNPPGNSPVSDILVEDIEVAGIAANGYDGKPLGLNTRFDSPSSNVTFRRNRTTRSVAGPVLVFANVAGINVADNVQPLTSGGLATFPNSTGRTGNQA